MVTTYRSSLGRIFHEYDILKRELDYIKNYSNYIHEPIAT